MKRECARFVFLIVAWMWQLCVVHVIVSDVWNTDTRHPCNDAYRLVWSVREPTVSPNEISAKCLYIAVLRPITEAHSANVYYAAMKRADKVMFTLYPKHVIFLVSLWHFVWNKAINTPPTNWDVFSLFSSHPIGFTRSQTWNWINVLDDCGKSHLYSLITTISCIYFCFTHLSQFLINFYSAAVVAFLCSFIFFAQPFSLSVWGFCIFFCDFEWL